MSTPSIDVLRALTGIQSVEDIPLSCDWEHDENGTPCNNRASWICLYECPGSEVHDPHPDRSPTCTSCRTWLMIYDLRHHAHFRWIRL